MYDRFTDRAHKVMQLANQEAQRLNHEYIGTEHILLGLVKEGSSVAAAVLKNLRIDLAKVRREVERLILPGPTKVTLGTLPQTPRAKYVAEYAIEEARSFGHDHVGTEHILLGLLREREGVAAQILMNMGLTLNSVREAILRLLGRPTSRHDDMSDSIDRFETPHALSAEREVALLYQELLGAWNKCSAAEFADLFAADANLVGFDGSTVAGQAAIAAHLSPIFALRPTAEFIGLAKSVRLLTPEVAVLTAVAGMVPPGKSDINPAVNAVQTLVAARQDGRWRIAVFHNTPAAFHGRPELSEQHTAELRQALAERQPPPAG